jgi:hypothetical protein
LAFIKPSFLFRRQQEQYQLFPGSKSLMPTKPNGFIRAVFKEGNSICLVAACEIVSYARLQVQDEVLNPVGCFLSSYEKFRQRVMPVFDWIIE